MPIQITRKLETDYKMRCNVCKVLRMDFERFFYVYTYFYKFKLNFINTHAHNVQA